MNIIKLDQAIQAVIDEPEYPGDPPRKLMDTLMSGDKELIIQALRNTVSLTKLNIIGRIIDRSPKKVNLGAVAFKDSSGTSVRLEGKDRVLALSAFFQQKEIPGDLIPCADWYHGGEPIKWEDVTWGDIPI